MRATFKDDESKRKCMENPACAKMVSGESKSRGLGDTIAKVTDALKIPKCGKCKKRQEKLNKRFPYKED